MWNYIIGHKGQIDSLKKLLASGKLPNAWLFSGVRGIGKRLVANTLAAAICCDSDDSPCGACVSCSKVQRGIHPDVTAVEPEKQTVKIDQIRELSQKVQFHPLESKTKVAIIDDAEAMSESAANSLLKILEEPPPQTHFILITASSHRILPTIRSRCQIISFSPLTDEEVVEYLSVSEGLSKKDAERAASFSHGSIGLAKDVPAEFIADVIDRFEAISDRASASDIISTSEVWASDASKVALTLDVIAGWYRSGLRGAVAEGDESGRVELLLDRLGKVLRARDLSETTANKQLMFEQLLFSVTR